MRTPQTGIFREATAHHHYLEYAVGGEPQTLKSALCAGLEGAWMSKGSVVVAFGRRAWSMLAPEEVPAKLADFQEMRGYAGTRVPSTQSDVFFWIQSDRIDFATDSALVIDSALASVGRRLLEERGFMYHKSRDLTGFEDGTANPKGTRRLDAALIPEGEIGAGGSYALGQTWVHDLAKFAALPVAEQERVIGRTKADSIELGGDAMPRDSHVSRTDVELHGVAQKIWRRSAPFGGAGRHGLFFLAFACDPGRFDIQLRRMYGLADDGLHDRLTEFSVPVSASYWFVPSEQALARALGTP